MTAVTAETGQRSAMGRIATRLPTSEAASTSSSTASVVDVTTPAVATSTVEDIREGVQILTLV